MNRVYRAIAALVLTVVAASPAGAATIDRIRTAPFGNYTQSFAPPGSRLMVLGSADVYELSDGTNWESGAGSLTEVFAGVSRVEADGNTLRYTLDLPAGSAIFQRIDYNAGDHSSNGRINSVEPLVLVAQAGSQTATLSGYGRVFSNEPANYPPPRFSYFAAPVGSLVPFQANYTLQGATTFTPTTFNAPFSYRLTGVIGLADFVPEPTGIAWLGIAGIAALSRRRSCPRPSAV